MFGPVSAAIGCPMSWYLGQSWPNPALGGFSTIKYAVKEAGPVRLRVYNIAGQKVRTLVGGTRPAGYHTARWDGRDQSGAKVSAGIYLFRLTTPAYRSTEKMAIIR